MKNIKDLISKATRLSNTEGEELKAALWNLIYYSPRMPNRLHQQQLIEEASTFQVEVFDEHFTERNLSVQGYKWGSGHRKVFLTHGWGSKALDFFELISLLKALPDFEIYAMDAPGNGSSEGELTSLLLYAKAVQAVASKFGAPEILIGHSLGAMANVRVVNEFGEQVKALISISPLVKLKDHFTAIMRSVNSSANAQSQFFEGFKEKFDFSADFFNLLNLYNPGSIEHLLIYDENDKVSPVRYIDEFLLKHPTIITSRYSDIGHEKMHKDSRVIRDIVEFMQSNNYQNAGR